MGHPFSLKGKNVLITGASSGIGQACAITASRLGATVILVGRNQEALEGTKAMLEKGAHVSINHDVTAFDKTDECVRMAVESAGKLHGMVHSAGIELTMPLNMMKPAHYEKLFSVNVIGGFDYAKTISKNKYMAEDGGSFVFISSIMADAGQSGLVGYCSSKGALVSGARAMAMELVSRKIRVNCILPGHVKGTRMAEKLFKSLPEKAQQAIINAHPLGLGDPFDVANACGYLLSDAAKWVTGTTLKVDGGYSAL
ncbi:MAG: SDR family oxidoreductase [Proteobacteria bacterium]|nr:SDR family oxidoreductase [Pseudomonadota bacterium]